MWRGTSVGLIIAVLISLGACAENSADLKRRVAILEKRLSEQSKEIEKVSGEYMAPRDFSPDIQRISDQQDRISEILKNKVDPINDRMEEFREWAREAQNEQTTNANLIQQINERLEKHLRAQKALEQNIKTLISDIGKLAVQVGNNRKQIDENSRLSVEMAKEIRKVRERAAQGRQNLLKAVKNTLIKLKDSTETDIMRKLEPIERRVEALSNKALDEGAKEAMSPKERSEMRRKTKELLAKIRELENIIAGQKASLLEVGSRVHKLETRLRASSGA